MKRILWALLLAISVGCVSGLAAPAAAQEGDGDESILPTEDSDRDEFWADRRHVRVLQRRLFEKDGELQLSLHFGIVPNDPFLKYYPAGLSLGYHLTETIGFEFGGSYIGEALRGTTELEQFIEDEYDARVDVLDQQMWRAGAFFMWSPLYGKMSFIGRKLVHFDWHFGAGAGVLATQSVSEDRTGMVDEFKPEVTVGTGMLLHLSQRFGLRLDLRQYIFQKAGGGVSMPTEFQLGASVFF